MNTYGMGSNYAAGDYYGYQAGGIGSFLKKAVGVVGGAVKGFVTGGVTGAIGGAVSAAAGKQKSTAVAKVEQAPMISYAPPGGSMIPVPATSPGAVPAPGASGVIQRLLPGGKSGYVSGASVGGAMPGYHWNKSYSYAKGLPAGSFLVRNRSMNPANAKSLRRAVRRQQSFIALARRVMKGTGMTIKRSAVGRTTRKRR